MSEALAPPLPANDIFPLDAVQARAEDTIFESASPGDVQDMIEAPCRALEVAYKSWRNLDHPEDRAELARDIAALIQRIKADKIPAVFLENLSDDRLVGRIAAETGARAGGTLYSDGLTGENGPAPTYIALVRHNIKALTNALGD